MLIGINFLSTFTNLSSINKKYPQCIEAQLERLSKFAIVMNFLLVYVTCGQSTKNSFNQFISQNLQILPTMALFHFWYLATSQCVSNSWVADKPDFYIDAN